MSYTYTSGPWKPFTSGTCNYVVATFDSARDLAIRRVNPVAEVFGRADDPDGHNLHVIAAAPRLLVAAEEASALLGVLSALPMSLSLFIELTNILDRLQIAIGAAHGEQS